MIVVACAEPITRDELFRYLLHNTQETDSNKIEKLLNVLISKHIIHFAETFSELLPQADMWKCNGWEAAADYHFFTWDAPFLDYSKEGGGHDQDRKNMVRYQEELPDTQRCKLYNDFLGRLSLYNPSECLPLFGQSIFTLLDKLKILFSLAFGKTGEKPCHWSDVPLIRRTSPSGGSRHPTEGYFFSLMEDPPKGCYHIQTDPSSLVHISSFSQEPTILKDNIQPCDGAIILTSVFERNMYRYREPRTFRTIHMDVGHVLQTIETISSELDIQIQVHLNFDEKEILQNIKSSKLEEGVMAVITINGESKR